MSDALHPRAEGLPPQKSFKDALSGQPILPPSSDGTKDGGIYKGEPALFFSKDEVNDLASPFQLVLIEKFKKNRLSMEFLRRGFTTIGFKGNVVLGLFDDRHIIIRFCLSEDYHRCWPRGSWNFKAHNMKVLKWSPNFKPD